MKKSNLATLFGGCLTAVVSSLLIAYILGADRFATPVARFAALPRQGQAPLEVVFSNNSEHSSRFEWDFGDSTPFSTESDPVHTYTLAGTYAARLKVCNSVGACDTQVVAITVLPASVSDLRPTPTAPLPSPTRTPTSTLFELPNTVPSMTPPPTATTPPTPRPTLSASPTTLRTTAPTVNTTTSGFITPDNASLALNLGTLYNDSRISLLAFTPDSRQLVVVDSSGTIKVWDVASGLVVRQWQQTGVRTLALSPDGSLVAGGGSDNHVYIWELASEVLLQTLQGHTAPVSSLAFNPTCPNPYVGCEVGLVSGGFDNRVRLWHLDTGEADVLSGHVQPITAVAFNPDGSTVVSGSTQGVMFEWNVRTRSQISRLSGHTATISALVFAPTCSGDGTCTHIMASTGEDRRLLLWDMASGQVQRELRQTHTAIFATLAFNPTGALVATGGDDFTVRLLGVEMNRELAVLTGHSNAVTTVAFSPNGLMLASGSTDSTIQLWGLEN